MLLISHFKRAEIIIWNISLLTLFTVYFWLLANNVSVIFLGGGFFFCNLKTAQKNRKKQAVLPVNLRCWNPYYNILILSFSVRRPPASGWRVQRPGRFLLRPGAWHPAAPGERGDIPAPPTGRLHSLHMGTTNRKSFNIYLVIRTNTQSAFKALKGDTGHCRFLWYLVKT